MIQGVQAGAKMQVLEDAISSQWNWGEIDATEWWDETLCSSSNLHTSCTEWHSCSN